MQPSHQGTTRFSNRVADYVRSRPRYPQGVLDILRSEAGLTTNMVVADIGSGTGFSSEPFLQNGNIVHGVEPNADMRSAAETLLAKYPDFRSVNGTAEATTMPDRSIDLIVAGQAFHWFDQVKTCEEFRRILREDGPVVLIWNTLQEDATPFMRAYMSLLHQFGTDFKEVVHTNVDRGQLQAFYGGDFVKRMLPNEQRFDREGLRSRLLSSSYTPPVGHPNHEPMLRELDRIFEQNQEGGEVRMEYATEVYVGRLQSIR
ncbi:MAG: SAM-dependent methyltransferase [Gemmataceae bacterium]|nr:SAM-dependent methyltransferase [Gemmataceae bacterium]